MTAAPNNPPIYHITHLSNLAGIVRAGVLWSDAQRHARGFAHKNVGLLHIKQRRLQRSIKIAGIDHGKLGEYVPFNFCNRSVMLYVLSRGHEDYSGGQDEILHLVSSVDSAIATGRRWAFTDRHADLAYARYFNNKADLKEVDWPVMPKSIGRRMTPRRSGKRSSCSTSSSRGPRSSASSRSPRGSLRPLRRPCLGGGRRTRRRIARLSTPTRAGTTEAP